VNSLRLFHLVSPAHDSLTISLRGLYLLRRFGVLYYIRPLFSVASWLKYVTGVFGDEILARQVVNCFKTEDITQDRGICQV